jgi:hypothetical protein
MNNPLLEEDFDTDPLTGLCDKAMHEMTDEQLRQHVMQIRQFRQSFQTYASEVRAKDKEVETKKQSKPSMKLDDLKGFF